MRMLVTSDWHLDWTTAGMRRLGDLEAAVDETVRYAIEQHIDVYAFLGDLMNPDSGARVFGCIELAARTAMRLSYAGIESHWLAGNHDVIEDGSGRTTLAPLKALQLREWRCDGHGHAQIKVHEDPTMVMLGNCQVRLATLPYAPLARAYDPAVFIASLPASDIPLIVAAHMTDIPGIVPGSETRDMPRGRGMPFPFESVAKDATPHKVLLNGHFHEQQVFRDVHIPGALERLTFGEQHHRPGWLVVEV